MSPTDSSDNRWRRFAHVLDPAPKYESSADAEEENMDHEMDDLVLVCVDGTWIPEVELRRRGFEFVRTETSSEIERAIDMVFKPGSYREQGE